MKYIIEIEEKPLCVFDKDTQTYFPRLWRVKGFNSLVFDEVGLSRLEELNSDYINEHFGDLQDDAYNKGYAQCQDDYGDALKHAKDTAYKKGLHDGESKCGYCNEYQRGLDDAWEAAKKIFGYEIDGGIPIDEVGRVFGYSEDATFCTADIIRHNTASEAIAKLKAYEEKQKADDKIEVGDEVKHKSDRVAWTAVVTRIISGTLTLMDNNGASADNYPIEEFVKTGRHFDIASILEAMKND